MYYVYSMIKMPTGITKNIKPGITFMRVGIANIDTTIPDPISPEVAGFKSKNATWTVHRLSTIFKILNHTNVSFYFDTRNSNF